MKKLIILFLLITGYSFAQDPFGKGNQTPIGFYTNYIGTATTSSGTATLNKLAGVITTDDLSGVSTRSYDISNTYVTTSSIVLITVECADFAANNVTYGIVGVNSGSFSIIVASSIGTFSGEAKIHFLIIN